MLLENSNMMTEDQFQMFKTLPKTVRDMMDFSARGSQISVGFYSETPRIAVRFGEPASYDAAALDRTVQAVPLSSCISKI